MQGGESEGGGVGGNGTMRVVKNLTASGEKVSRMVLYFVAPHLGGTDSTTTVVVHFGRTFTYTY